MQEMQDEGCAPLRSVFQFDKTGEFLSLRVLRVIMFNCLSCQFTCNYLTRHSKVYVKIVKMLFNLKVFSTPAACWMNE